MKKSGKDTASESQPGRQLPWIGRALRWIRSATPTRQGDALRQSLLRLVAIRVCVLSLVFASAAVDVSRTNSNEQNLYLVFWPIALIYCASLLNVLALRYGQKLALVGSAQLAVDVLLASVAAQISLSPASPILYLLVVMGAAAVFGKHGAVLVASASGLCYGILKMNLLPWGVAHDPPTVVELLLVYISLIVIALISAHVAELVHRLGIITNQQAQSLSALTRHQQELFDNISLGIITLDIQGAVSSMNRAARALLGVIPEQCVGQPFAVLLKQIGLPEASSLFVTADLPDEAREATLRIQGREVHLSYIVRALVDSNSQRTGTIVMFNDVSHVRSMEERLSLHEQMTKLLANERDLPGLSAAVAENLLMVGESSIMKQVFTLVDRVATSDASVLITGESGTGKEVIAKAIHARGPRRLKPFVAINCGAIPENLLESELFGHKKGAFTGAVHDNPGLFRQAHNGTLFLDEVGELPAHMQTKLLRVLQERKVRAVGDVHDIPIDVRVIAATNRDLKKEIARNAFREDLYYRLNVVNIPVPPLRERREDIPLLVRHFIGQLCDPDRVLPQISPEALQILMNYPFPGNIRELENLIERALVLGGQAVLPEHLPEEVRNTVRSESSNAARLESARAPSPTNIIVLPIDLEGELSRIERDYLFRALEKSGGMKKQAAELLGLNFRSFRYRLKKYGLGEGLTSDSDDN